MTDYYAPTGGLPPQTALHTGRAVFTPAYAVIPRGVYSDIVTSFLPGWQNTRAWIIARPMTGFSETFSHYLMEVAPHGGSTAPDPTRGAGRALRHPWRGLADLDGQGTTSAPAASPTSPRAALAADQRHRPPRALPLDPQAVGARAGDRPPTAFVTSTTPR
jgi:(S)-ureidoglycine aminohydrolase